MSPQHDRGPVDYDPDDPRTLRAIIEGMTMARGDYNEGSSKLEKWLLSTLTVLLVAGISGAIAGYAKLSALEERTVNIQSQVNDIKRLVEPHYRGETP